MIQYQKSNCTPGWKLMFYSIRWDVLPDPVFYHDFEICLVFTFFYNRWKHVE